MLFSLKCAVCLVIVYALILCQPGAWQAASTDTLKVGTGAVRAATAQAEDLCRANAGECLGAAARLGTLASAAGTPTLSQSPRPHAATGARAPRGPYARERRVTATTPEDP